MDTKSIAVLADIEANQKHERQILSGDWKIKSIRLERILINIDNFQ
ncbi:hypothetical protein [Chitinophaga ginsengisoli]|uniref:Uncharacterized protein n=1 Tax=Chitinophaga ginsengisoli TaxID=363837 RepID=A0A2P8GAE1_9BACT|nr:hypothetical protein [Chitinophaga ginsengisoli]PSL30950.1 hypothetical protein CLV42_105311 [Chitinophaga ginsengisoli]